MANEPDATTAVPSGGHKWIPQSRGLFVIILVADMLNTIVRESIFAANGDPQASALAAVIIFVLIAVLFFGSLTVIHFIYLCIYKHHYTSFISSGIQTLGALLYFYGDNITYLLGQYGPELGCDQDCVIDNRIAATFCLGAALIIFQVVPTMLHKIIKMTHGKSSVKLMFKYPDWLSAIDMITVLVRMDTLFSAVVVMAESADFCSRSDIATSVSFIVVCTTIGIIAECIYWFYALRSNKDNEKVFTALLTFGLCIVIISFPLYILADNHQPLDCAFSCDTFASNTTLNTLLCNQSANSGTRIAFTVVTFIMIVTVAPIYFVCQKRNTKKMDTKDIELETFS